MPVTARTLRLLDEVRTQVDTVVDAQVRDLVAAWVDAWDEVAPDLTAVLLDMLTAGDRVTRAQLLRSQRLRRALAVIAAQLEALAEEAGVRITGDLAAVIELAGAAQASVLDSQLPAGFITSDDFAAWSRVHAGQLAAIVARSTEQITSRTAALSTEAYQVVRRELIRGVAAGSNPRETARRMVQRAESGFNGGLSRALVIARTETLDAHRAAAQLSQEQHADVLAGWVWLSRLDARTCPSCWAQHGRLHDLDEAGPHDHHQGRCVRMAKTKTWAELGWEGVPEPDDVTPDAGAEFELLTAAEQQQILGPKRYVAWAAGNYPMGSWSVRRSTDGWRDAFHVSPAPSGGRRSRNAA